MRLAGLVVVLLALGCGKERVAEPFEKPWDDATPANGFRAVVAPACQKVDGAHKIPSSSAGSIQDIATAQADALAADEHYVYWSEGKELHRAERASSPWPRPWTNEIIVTSELPIVDVAVTDGRIYWVGAVGADAKTKSLFYLDKKTMAWPQTFLPDIGAPMSKLLVRGESLLYVLGNVSYEVTDLDGQTPVPAGGTSAAPIIAADTHTVYTYSRDGFIFTMPRRHPWQVPTKLVAANDPVDMFSDETFLYWLEREGKLRRVAVAGGAPTDLFVGIPNAVGLTMVKGVLWISTAEGLLRYDPKCHLSPARIAPMTGIHGRAVPVGEALAVLGSSPRPHIALLAAP